MKRCINPECGAELDDNAKFCPECGTKQPQEYVCPACGAKFDQPSKFCMACGAKMDGTGGAPKIGGLSIGDNNAISAKDIIGGDKIEAQNYVVNNVMGPQKSEAELKMDNLSMKKMSKEYIREEMAKAKDFEKKNNFFGAASIYRELASEDNVDAVCSLLSLDYNNNLVLEAAERNSLMGKIMDAVNASHPEGLFLYGVNIIESDRNKGIEYLKRAAQCGNEKAVEYLNKYYGRNRFGNCREDISEEALQWFEQSEKMGNPEGKFLLARCYFYGNGTLKQQNKAYRMFCELADAQYDEALYMKAYCCLTGEGIPYDNVGEVVNNAESYLKDAASRGERNAEALLGLLYHKGMGPFEKNDHDANLYLRKASEHGDRIGQYVFANYLGTWDGKDVDKDAMIPELLKKSAEQGFSNAQNMLGECYEDERYAATPKDITKAVELYKLAAEQNNVAGLCNLGRCYYEGIGVEQNYEKAVELFTKGFEEYTTYVDPKYIELHRDFDYINKGREICLWLGKCYHDGTGVAKDNIKALDFLKMYNGHKDIGREDETEIVKTIMQEMGSSYYYNNDLTSSSKIMGVVLVDKGSLAFGLTGKLKSIFNLGLKEAKHLTDQLPKTLAVVTQAQAMAVRDELASEGAVVMLKRYNSEREAKNDYYNLGLDKMILSSDVLEKAEKYSHQLPPMPDRPLTEKIFNKYMEEAKAGDEFAKYIIGDCYFYGEGVEQNYEEAVKLYQEASNDPRAIYSLGFCYYEGCVVEQDFAKGFSLFKKAAEMGYDQAQYRLGRCYSVNYETVVQNDDKEAFTWFKKAAEQGHVFAMFKLFDCYSAGRGVEKNDTEAKKWAIKVKDSGVDPVEIMTYDQYKDWHDFERSKKNKTTQPKTNVTTPKPQPQPAPQPTQQPAPQPQPQPAAPAKTETSSGTVRVILINAGAQKLVVVKAVKEYLNLGLKESMDLVSDHLPNTIATLDEAQAQEFYNILTGLGANVEIRTGGSGKAIAPAQPESQPQAQPKSQPQANDANIFNINGVKLEMVTVESGTFTMGENQNGLLKGDEHPAHQVALSEYHIGKYPVTVAQFRQFVEATGYTTQAELKGRSMTMEYVEGRYKPIHKDGLNWKYGGDEKPRGASDDNHPVIHISWIDANAFCKWLAKVTGKNFRLPTEAEWEFAAKGGVKSKGFRYSGSDNYDEVAVYKSKNTAPVGTKKPNELGIYDMSGNVAEWCNDWQGKYSRESQVNPQGPSTGLYRVSRSASWFDEYRSDTVRRSGFNVTMTGSKYGFRVAYSDDGVKVPPKPAALDDNPTIGGKSILDIDDVKNTVKGIFGKLFK